jgi:O-methyltransferase
MEALAAADPETADLLRQAAHARSAAGDVPGEMKAWQRLLQLADDGEAHARLAYLLEKLGQSSEAAWHLEALESADPAQIQAWATAIATSLGKELTFAAFPETQFHRVPDFYGRAAPKLIDFRTDERFYRLAQEARAERRTLLYLDRLHTLYQAMADLARRLPEGETARTIEIGVFRGGASCLLASVAQELLPGRVGHYAVDTFAGHAAEDIPSGAEGAHLPRMFGGAEYADVARYLSRFDFVQVMKGRVQDLLPDLRRHRFHFVHLDVDLFEPTLFVLTEFYPLIEPGAAVVVDDYGFVTCPGVREAVVQYLAKNPRHFTKFELPTGQCILVK